jgi:ABC-2 type transport system ATP-binding protein
MIVIKTRNLTKKFGSLIAVNKINLEIESGEFFGFLGPNAAGKTTVLILLTGQIKPTSGKIKVLGIDVVKNPVKIREFVGIVPE